MNEVDSSSSHFHVKLILKGKNRSVLVNGMVDSGATALFISPRFVAKHHIIPRSLPREIGLRNIDGTENKSGSIRYSCTLTVTVGGYTAEHEFLVADLGPEDVILGLPWLREVNPSIHRQRALRNQYSGYSPSTLVECVRSQVLGLSPIAASG